jgi:hypothetical protein
MTFAITSLKRRRPSRTFLTAILAAAAASTAFAAVAVASPANAANAATTTARTSTWSSHTGWPGAAAGGWRPGAGPSTWAPSSAARTEYFHVVSTKPSGPGTIIVTGVINAGGTEEPGRAIDGAVFASGSFRIDHSAGQPTVRFDSATCVGTITQAGPFEVIDATGDMGGLAGSGRYVFQALYTTDRVAGHCSSTMTAYTETIEGVERGSVAGHLDAGVLDQPVSGR